MSIHYNTVNFPLKILAALFALTVFFFSLSIPACAEENTEPAGPSQAEMDEAYDEAMMQADSEITFYTMEDLNYRLAVIMKFVSGKMTDEDFAELDLVVVFLAVDFFAVLFFAPDELFLPFPEVAIIHAS